MKTQAAPKISHYRQDPADMVNRMSLCGLKEHLAGHEGRAPLSLWQCHLALISFPARPAFLCLFSSPVSRDRQKSLCLINGRLSHAASGFLDSKLQMALVQTWFACIASIELMATLVFFCHASLWCTLSGILSYCLNDNLEQPQSVAIQWVGTEARMRVA